MSNYATRDATFILTESNNWTAWYRQLKIRCESLNIWALADLEGSQEPQPKSRLQLPLVLSNYESIATLPLSTTTASSSRTRGNTQLSQREEPVVVDIPTRMRIETYRFLKKEYNEEHAKYEKLLVYILGTVSSHLQLSCCYTGNSTHENPNNWEPWLMEYDQSATRAEALEVSESKQKSAFVIEEASFLASGESDQNTLRDALDISQRAPPAYSQGNLRKPRKKRKSNSQETKSKQFLKRNTMAVGDDYPACGQRHNLSDYYYAFPKKAPKWFKPNRKIARLVKHIIKFNNEL
ncbi:hypothetical protein COCCADRAFT_41049 [Bipolaris zeicola 26-R-13]|uniref:Uncharacterized protein n=1 Tax=Cochliobolus carbonum (strain 26-R-13) TaxID=930089 RepID=W6YBA6_COCC2|nr:uncharacterized protein COCCADRAFT_41049 [Bipolaris zeicola 26-R-13]EUC28441.1 hypothetical protein COCCADRAFT_41049 [Bipolaris zeicola 26-R-13]